MCSGHGTCVDGVCICDENYSGTACAEVHATTVPLSVCAVAYFFAAVGIAACVGLAVWTVVMRHNQVLRRGTLLFLLLITLGSVLCLAACFPIGAQSNPWELDTANVSRACNGYCRFPSPAHAR